MKDFYDIYYLSRTFDFDGAKLQSAIYETLQRENGFLPFKDKSDSEAVKNRFHMSKNAFKRAIGHLYKERLITIEKDGIHLND